MNKIIILICVIFTQISSIAQTSDSKLMQLNKRKEIKNDLNSDFFKHLKEIYPGINENELLIIDYFPKNDKCKFNLTQIEIEKYSQEFQQKVNDVINNNTICIIENNLNDETQNKTMSELIKKELLNKSHHCYNRILVYKNKFIALLGDYNDEEALDRIKKIVK